MSLASGGLLVGSSTFAYATPAANTATTSAGGGSLGTPSGLATTFPSATGGVGTSAASATKSIPRAITMGFVVAACLYLM